MHSEFINRLSGPAYSKEKEVVLYMSDNGIESCMKPEDFFQKAGQEVKVGAFTYTAFLLHNGEWITGVSRTTVLRRYEDELDVTPQSEYKFLRASLCTWIEKRIYPGIIPTYMIDYVNEKKWFVDEQASPETFDGMMDRMKVLFRTAGMCGVDEEKYRSVKKAIIATLKNL